MKIFGKDTKRHQILEKVGDITQLGGIKYYEFADGVSKGVRAFDISSPQGIDMTVLIDRGMDISEFRYKGIPLAWKSVTRETSPVFYESKDFEWLRTFYGGLLTTCGLTYFGMPCTDEGEELGLHGRISNLPAENPVTDCFWQDDSYIMTVSAKVREAKVFGDKLEMCRKISTAMDSKKITVEDTVTNIGHKSSPFMVLYHINLGYPLLDAYSKIIEPKAKVTARDKEADKGIDNYFEFSEPIADFGEQVFFHDITPDKDGLCNIALINEKFDMGKGLGLYLRFKKEELPNLIQWKQTGQGEYVCGLEPTNSFPRGRDIESKEGNVRFLRPGEKAYQKIEIGILDGIEDIQGFKEKIRY